MESIRSYAPSRMYIVADGAKNQLEYSETKRARELVEVNIDWKCNVVKLYSDTNLGLRARVVSGLNHVFEQEESAIILEDDLIVDKSFFPFCEKLLIKYAKQNQVISIAGNNFQFGKFSPSASYYFSRYVHSWGWATWARAWHKYDDQLSGIADMKSSHQLRHHHNSKVLERYWMLIFDLVQDNKFDSWAYRWSYAAFKNKMLTIIPEVNLVSNIGYGIDSTHTRLKSKVMGMPTESVKFPLSHPKRISSSDEADKNTARTLYLRPRTILGLIIKKFLG